MSIQAEEWRPAVGHPDYEVSNYGKIRAVACRRGMPRKNMKECKYWNDLKIKYHRSVYMNRVKWPVHRVVALAFLGPAPSSSHVVMHLDEESSMPDAAWNLRWGTPKENSIDASTKGRLAIGTRNGNSKLTPEDIKAIRESHLSGPKIAAIYAVSSTLVYNIRSRKVWRHVP